LLGGALLVVAGLVTLATLTSGPAVAQAQAVPVNTGEPAISGTATVGSTLVANNGNWSNSPTSFTYQWVRCPSSGGAGDGSNCATIASATTASYVVVAGDTGFTLRIRVTATNVDGSQTAASNHTAIVTAATSGPANTQQPSVSGTAQVAQTLTGTNGTWTGATPITYAYQWVRCPSDGGAADGSNCAAIGGATSITYVVQSGDVGFRLRLRVSATNSAGTHTAASNATDTVSAGGAPVNSTRPVITGNAVQASQVVASLGIWTGTAPITFAVQWVRCGTDGGNADASNCSPISGATGVTYVVQAADVGMRLRTRITASTAAGSGTVTSIATATVTSSGTTPTPPNPTPPTGGVIPVESVVAPERLVVDKVQFVPNPVRSRTTPIVVRVHIMDTQGHGVSNALVFVRTTPIVATTPPEQPTAANGWATLTLTPRADFPLKTGHSVQVFVRTRKAGDPLLAGISNRRLVQVRTAG